MIWHYDKDLVATHSVRAVTTVRRNTCRLPTGDVAGAHGKLVVGAGGVWPWSHSRTKTMPRYPLMNLIPPTGRKKLRGNPTMAAAVRALLHGAGIT